jgi:Hydrazine synthase alpha subunit middle domain
MSLLKRSLVCALVASPIFLLGMPKEGPPGRATTQDSERPDIIFVEAPTVASGGLTERFPQGSRLVRLQAATGSRSVTNLTPEFFAAADPQVSADGTRILFSGQKARKAAWQVWEMKADGSDQRQLTHCPGDCLKPDYLPRGQIVYTAMSSREPRRSSAIYVAGADGARAHPVTFGPGQFQVETVLRDGRVLVSAESPLLAAGKGQKSRALYTMKPDGSELCAFRRELHPVLTLSGAEELEDGTVLFVERSGTRGREPGGQLAWIRPGTLHNSVITPAQSLYGSARELQGKTLVVAEGKSGSPESLGKFDLYTFDLESKTLGKLIYRNPKFSSVQAVALAPHAAPRIYWSILHLNRDSGRFICLNSYASADAPRGRLTAPIARVRLILLEEGGSHERVLGEAPVESDGSFYVSVPANRPVRFELLGARGQVIQAQRSWIWVRPGEDRGCLGCHEDKARAPENHWPLALKRLDTPIPVGLPVHPQPAHE